MPATTARDPLTDAEFKAAIVEAIRPLRSFGISLTGKADRADDLVQETLTKAWAHRKSFQRDSNLHAWLFTILRNEFYSTLRKRRREVEDADGKRALNLSVAPDQMVKLDVVDMQAALSKLPVDQREALLLVTASDLSYEDAALVCGVATGTIKSRVNRARNALAKILGIESSADVGVDSEFQAALNAPAES